MKSILLAVLLLVLSIALFHQNCGYAKTIDADKIMASAVPVDEDSFVPGDVDSATPGDSPEQPPVVPRQDPPVATPNANDDTYTSPVKVQVDVTRPTFDGKTISVSSGGDLQAAIDSANPGDIIELEPGAVFTGTFVLPAKANPSSKWILVRTAGVQPPEGKRIDPAVHAASMAVIQTRELDTASALKTESGASYYRVENVTIRAHQNPAEFKYRVYDIVRLSHSEDLTTTILAMEHLPHHIVFDRVYVYGNMHIGARRGFAFNGRHLAVVNSYVAEIKEAGADSQAIGGWMGSGPFKIENNYLAGAGENIMFGGAPTQIVDLVPSDIEVVRNHFYKPLRWNKKLPEFEGTAWVVKNLFELKNAQRVLVEGNIFENHWGGQGQSGFSILFTPRTGKGGVNPWAVVQDVLFQHNTVKNIAQGINLMGEDTNNPNDINTNNIVIYNNKFEDIGAFDTRCYWLLWSRKSCRMTIANNTVRYASSDINHGVSVTANSRDHKAQTTDLHFHDNVVEHQQYGFKGDGLSVGTETLEANYPGLKMTGNYFLKKPDDRRDLGSIYPTGNTFVEAGASFNPGSAGVDMDLLRRKQHNP